MVMALSASITKSRPAYVVKNADNLALHEFSTRLARNEFFDSNPLSEGIDAWKKPPGEFFVYYRNSGTGVRVLLIDATASTDANAQCVDVTRRDHL